jgi:hypothetical protein
MEHVMVLGRSGEVHELQAREDTEVDLSQACILDGPCRSRYLHLSLL